MDSARISGCRGAFSKGRRKGSGSLSGEEGKTQHQRSIRSGAGGGGDAGVCGRPEQVGPEQGGGSNGTGESESATCAESIPARSCDGKSPA